MLNRIKFMLVLAALIGAVCTSTSLWAAAAVATSIQGEVAVARGSSADVWEPITADTALESGDSIRTREGSCTLTYSDQATFVVTPNTQVTVTDKANAQELQLLAGRINGKVNKEKVVKPFQVMTPAAVAAIRGTEVDFGYNDQGEMTVDLHNGAIQVLNEETALSLDLGGSKKIKVKYDKQANTLLIKNECESDGPITFNILGTSFTQSPCDEQVIDLATAENSTQVPGFTTNNEPENPDEGREPISPSQP